MSATHSSNRQNQFLLPLVKQAKSVSVATNNVFLCDGLMRWCRLNMCLDAAKGMMYLHSSEPPIIHRDLKSPNLLVDKHWRVKVCDFNLSRVMEETVVLSSMAASNPRWLAPEILSGRGYTYSSDVYSFGIIMWEFLTWRVPWHECGPWQVIPATFQGGYHLSGKVDIYGYMDKQSWFPGANLNGQRYRRVAHAG